MTTKKEAAAPVLESRFPLQGLPRPVVVGDELIQLTSRELKPLKRGEEIRLLSWNVQKYFNRAVFRDLFNLYQDSDLVLLQEALSGHAYHPLYDQMGSVEWWAARNLGYSGGVFAGLTTGSKFHLDKVSALRSPGHEPILRTPKASLLTAHPIEGSEDPLIVVNVHGINFATSKAFRLQFQKIHEAVKDHKGPLVVAGDFNTHLPDRKFLASSFAESLRMKIVDFHGDKRFLKLDQVLYRGFEISKANILDDVRSSDHAPVVARMGLK